jgi:outer membrane protein
MRKKFYLIAGFVLIVSFLISTNDYAAESKIGFINLPEIMKNTNAGKKAAKEFKQLYDKKREAIVAAEKDLKNLKEELDKQGPIMTENARREKGTGYQRKLRDYQLLVEDTNKELKVRDQEASSKLIPQITKVVRKVAEKEKYTLVIDIARMPVPYYAKERDFSNKVIEEFNKLPGVGQ